MFTLKCLCMRVCKSFQSCATPCDPWTVARQAPHRSLIKSRSFFLFLRNNYIPEKYIFLFLEVMVDFKLCVGFSSDF